MTEPAWKLHCAGHLTRFSALPVLTYRRTLRSGSRKPRQLTRRSEFPGRLLALFFGFAFLALPAFAASEVKVTADNFVVTDSKHEAVFTGNVQIVHPNVTLKGDKVVVSYGAGGTSDVKTLDATGHVWLKTTEQTATGDHAVFDPKTQILKLSGNVEVVNASGTLNGPELTVNLKTQTSTFTSSKGGRVTGVFSSQ